MSVKEFNIFNNDIENNTQIIRLKKACEREKKGCHLSVQQKYI